MLDSALQLEKDIVTVASIAGSWDERQAIRNVLKELRKLQHAKSWENPYTAAISVLEQHARAFEGGYG